MGNIYVLIIGALQILLLNLVLSADNVGVIALATKNLPAGYARKASALGITAAIVLRIFFTSIIAYILMIQWLPVKLVGGLVLIKITWDFIKPQEEEETNEGKVSERFWEAVLSIIVADITMSLDNVLAIGAAAKGNNLLIIFGLVMSIPILFFGSQFVTELMRKYTIVIYIGGAILAYTAFGMICEDELIVTRLPSLLKESIPYIAAAAAFIYGVYLMQLQKKSKEGAHQGMKVMQEELAAHAEDSDQKEK